MIYDKSMIYFKEFPNLSKDDVAIAGGKGAALGELKKASIPVPDGFVILSDAFEQFLDENNFLAEIDSILHKVNHKEIHTIERASEEIKALILNGTISKEIEKEIKRYFKNLGSKFVAVRSSATSEDSSTAAWAGQLETYLNTTEKDLLENVKKCWASLFTPRAIFYRFEKNLHKEKISVAVVVQKMINSEVSGIAFSVHPVTQDRNQLIIEAGFGLGEAIVSGQITPDSYIIEKEPRRIITKNISKQEKGLYKIENGGNEWKEINRKENQKLNDKEILELSEIILKIEKHSGFPVDIEWALEKNRFYIVQSRPITTLTFKQEEKKQQKLKQVVTRKYGLLTSELFIDGLSNPENYQHLLLLPDCFVSTGVVSDKWFFGPEIAVLGKRLLEEEMKKEGFVFKMFSNVYNYGEKLLRKSEKIKEKDLSKLKSEELIKEFVNFSNLYKIFAVSLAGWGLQIPIEAKLRELLKERKNIDEDLATLTFPKKQNIVNIEQEEILKIAEVIRKKRISFDNDTLTKEVLKLITKHINKFGWMTRGGLDEPWAIKDVLDRLKDLVKEDCTKKISEIIKWRKENEQKSELLLKEIKADKQTRRLVDISKELVYYRTYRTDYLNLVMFNIRPLLFEIGKRLGYNFIEISYLRPKEIINFRAIDKKELQRRMEQFLIFTVDKNQIIFSADKDDISKLEDIYVLKEIVDKKVIKGNTAFQGKVVGQVVIILSKKDLSKVKEGDIIITPMTTPDYIVAMQKAAAFVTDEGGITCHAAIVAREMKKPCIIGTKIATQILKNGNLIEVDANNGIVNILDSKSDNFEKSTDCIRMFEATGMPFLINSIALEHYKPLRAIAIFRENLWTTYLPKLIEKETLKEGIELFGSKALFNEYKREFDDYKNRSVNYFENLLKKKEITEEELEEYFNLISEHWKYYSKTEFFYVDDAYLKSKENKVTAQNLKHLEEIKNSGREHLNKLIFGSNSYLSKILTKISEKFKINLNDLFFYSKEEILNLYKNQKVPNPLLEERKQSYVFTIKDKNLFVLSGNKAKDFISNFSVKITSDEIKGTIANKGKVQGKAKVLFYGADTFDKVSKMIEEMEKGNILVTETTSPEIITACKKASAILTNQGGLLSHAAIVSRELGIPCIVGLGNITHLVKDGDILEVDGDKGVVKILKKK